MEKQDAIHALSALAHETRLDVFRRLVRAGTEGLPAGALAQGLGIVPATLSFHLKELRNARLVTSRREGRSIRYAPDFSAMSDLIAYLGENCCEGDGEGRGGSCGTRAETTKRPGKRSRGGR